jgi:hypothetical protein
MLFSDQVRDFLVSDCGEELSSYSIEMGKTLKKNKLWPPKYYRGLTRKQALERKKEIQKFSKFKTNDPKAYVGFKTDKYAKTKKKSKYTEQWDKLFPDAKSLEEHSKVTGVPLKHIDHVYRKGLSAWRTGHRPGAGQSQWGYARLKSYLLCGKSHYTADAADVRRAKLESASARKWFKRCKTSKLTRI